jgi:hypothetical protein
VVSSPSSCPTGFNGWNVYVWTSSGAEARQNSSSLTLGQSWTENTSGVSKAGVAPPDNYPGDVRNALVDFVNLNTYPATTIVSGLKPGLVSSTDTTTGTVTYNWNITINCNSAPCSQQYTIGIMVHGYYTRNSSADDTVVTVAQPGLDFVTGGGYLVMKSSSGLYPGAPNSKNNFGFNAKYNNSGTNLQGNLNTIIRNNGRVYQIKGNSLTSLSVTSFNGSAWVSGCANGATATKPCKATFNSKASIQDITDPNNVISIDGNASLQVTMTDYGSGTTDTIGLTVWNKSGGVWFSSDWTGSQTAEQTLAGGNLAVH